MRGRACVSGRGVGDGVALAAGGVQSPATVQETSQEVGIVPPGVAGIATVCLAVRSPGVRTDTPLSLQLLDPCHKFPPRIIRRFDQSLPCSVRRPNTEALSLSGPVKPLSREAVAGTEVGGR